MATAIVSRVPIVVLLLNDNAFGFVRWKQRNLNFEDFGMDLANPDFVKYAESFRRKGNTLGAGDRT